MEELKDKKAEAKEKKESSEAAFKAWLSKKQSENNNVNNNKNVNKNEKSTDPPDKDKSQRLEAAKEAYESWLDYVEQREDEERFAEEERILRELWRPPWYPGGIADF